MWNLRRCVDNEKNSKIQRKSCFSNAIEEILRVANSQSFYKINENHLKNNHQIVALSSSTCLIDICISHDYAYCSGQCSRVICPIPVNCKGTFVSISLKCNVSILIWPWFLFCNRFVLFDWSNCLITMVKRYRFKHITWIILYKDRGRWYKYVW